MITRLLLATTIVGGFQLGSWVGDVAKGAQFAPPATHLQTCQFGPDVQCDMRGAALIR